MLRFKREELNKNKEWILPNGKGGYASSTIIGLNTRRYHGLLITSEQILQLATIQEELQFENKHYSLGCNDYEQFIHPEGHKHLSSFTKDPFPTYTYTVPEAIVEKKILLPKGHNTVIIAYTIHTNKPFQLRLYPLTHSRTIHNVADLPNFIQESNHKITVLKAKHLPPLIIGSDLAHYTEQENWHENIHYEEEHARGYEAKEDLYTPGYFNANVKTGTTKLHIIAAGGKEAYEEFHNLYSSDPKNYQALFTPPSLTQTKDPILNYLLHAADSFVTENNVLTGYPWSSHNNEETLLSLPGLLIIPGKINKAKTILKHLKTEILSSSVESRLLFIYATYKLNQPKFVKEELWKTMQLIIENVKSDIDKHSFLQQEAELTIFWYNSLKIMASFSQKFEENNDYDLLALHLKKNFNEYFWNSQNQCLYNHLGEHTTYLQATQILALSLPFPLLDPSKERLLLKNITRELFTVKGLRSLTKKSPHYRGRYVGNETLRQKAYNQGTIWPWTLGHYITAYLRINNHSFAAHTEIEEKVFLPLLEEFREAGIGTISEYYDGDALKARGAPSSALSIAEILRAYVEDYKKEPIQLPSQLSQ